MPTLEEILESKLSQGESQDNTNPTVQSTEQFQEATVPQGEVSVSPTTETTTETTESVPPVVAPDAASKIVNWEKRYNDLQSDIDRRVNNAAKNLSVTYDAKINQLIDTLARQQATVAPVQQEEAPFADLDPAQKEQLDKYLAVNMEKMAREKLGYDPEKQELTNVRAAFEGYRSRYSDSQNYDFLIAPLLNEFVEIDPKVDRNWDRMYSWARNFVTAVLSAKPVTSQEAVGRASAQPKTPVSPSTGGQLTAEQRSSLEKQAELLKTQLGVSVGSAPSRGRLSLEAIIEKNLDNPVRR